MIRYGHRCTTVTPTGTDDPDTTEGHHMNGTATDARPIATGVTPERLANLRIWNLGLTALHAAQAVVILIIGGTFGVAVTTTFPEGPPGTRTPAPDTFFTVRIAFAIALFLGLAALDHLLTSTAMRDRYEDGLRSGINRFRWVEYSVSATLMLILIAMYGGITDITSLLCLAGANSAMIFFGWLQERMNPPGRTTTTMMPFWFGTLAGLFPWAALIVNIVGAETVPGFVYGIIVAEFVFFFSFGLNQWLQYRGVGKWRDYVYGEKVYLVLSLAAKSVLAWQIYGGSLAN
ncbi:MAG: heliorhodopsin HeR [Ilumatobacteraceae bacterium]